VENRGFWALEAPPKREKHKIHKVLFIDKIKRAARSGVCSNAGCAFERTRACVCSFGRAFDRSCNVVPLAFECRRCVRTQITAHGARLKR
jgi:hypothetical protein